MADQTENNNDRNVFLRLTELIDQLSKQEQLDLLNEIEIKQGKERREHSRKSLFTVVDYRNSSRTYRDFIKNISFGGIFIETPQQLSVGETLLLTFQIPKSNKPIKVEGEIVQTTPQGVGIRFLPTKKPRKRNSNPNQ
jgi:uncharacterized protein (TIGR02266 family)